jgi:hypothetical protein
MKLNKFGSEKATFSAVDFLLVSIFNLPLPFQEMCRSKYSIRGFNEFNSLRFVASFIFFFFFFFFRMVRSES